MARADIIIKLLRAGTDNDQAAFRKVAETLIASEKAKKHFDLAERMQQAIVPSWNKQTGGAPTTLLSTTGKRAMVQELVYEITPEKCFENLSLPADTLATCKGLVKEQMCAEQLLSRGIEPRHRVLLIGLPGNGKTTTAEALAHALACPLVVVRYENLIGSFLGETSSRIQNIFEQVRTRRCVLFFDEFDTIGKERGDTNETGEIKRVVSSLLLQLDRLPHYVVVIAASNHSELLDKAVWRRFQIRLNLMPPTNKDGADYLRAFSNRSGIDLGRSPERLSEDLAGGSFAEIEEFCIGAQRNAILAGHPGTAAPIMDALLREWRARSLVSGRNLTIASDC